MENIKNNSMKEIMSLLSQTWQGTLIVAGIIAGLFDLIKKDEVITVDKISRIKKYDQGKIEKWLYYCEKNNLVQKKESGYCLTEKGHLFSMNSSNKDLIGLIRLTEFYMNAGLQSKDTFMKGKSLDKLSDGKISRYYQPKVSDNFSLALYDVLKEYKISSGDTLLDVGCGNGTFLRKLLKYFPDVKFTGIDKNLFAIEKGKKENISLNISDRIKLLVGDITEDLESFEDKSFDWITAINIFHFVPKDLRFKIVDQLVRIVRKGVFMTEVVVETTPLSQAADPLMFLLWNDYTGFFMKEEYDKFNQKIKKHFKGIKFNAVKIMLGNNNLIVLMK